MSQFPHQYVARASAEPAGLVRLTADGLPNLTSAPPTQFNGPGDQWSPEDLLMAAVADCFVLSFRAIAEASKFPFDHIDCQATGTLDRVERQVKFTELKVHAQLRIGADADSARAQNLLEKADRTCFITNSLAVEPELTTEITDG